MYFKLGLLMLLVLLKKSSGKAEYDCRRLEDCKNGGTCNAEGDASGTCTCASGYGGYNCQIIQGTTCDDASLCENGGTCYKDAANTDTCGCAYTYIGDTCQDEYVTVACSGDSMKIDLTFPGEFDGIVSLNPLDPESPPPASCDFATAASADGLTEVSNLDIKVSDATAETVCGQEHVASSTNVDTGAVTYSTHVRVQYSKFIFSGVDEIYNISCIHTGADVQLYTDMTNMDVSAIGNFTMVQRNKTYSPVEFAIIDVDGNPLTADTKLYVGSPFLFHLYLTDAIVYKDILIDSCTTNNTLEGDDMLEYKIFDKGCPTKEGRRVTDEQVSRLKADMDGDGVQEPGKSITIKAFKFVDTDKLGIVCTAKVCKEGEEAECQIPSDCNAVINAPATTDAATSSAAGAPTMAAEDAPTDAGTTGTEAVPTAETGTTGTEEAPTAESGTTGTEAAPTAETGTTSTEAAPTAETGTTGTEAAPTAETGTTGTEAAPTAETGSATETGSSITETGATATETGSATTAGGTTTGSEASSTGGSSTTVVEASPTAGIAPAVATGGEALSEGGAGAGAGGGGRRKRRAAKNASKKETVSTVLTVLGPSDYHKAASAEHKVSKIEECLTQTEILAVVIVLGSVVVILFIACFVLACAMLKRKGNKTNEFKSLVTYHKTDKFHIPRAHVAHVNEAYSQM